MLGQRKLNNIRPRAVKGRFDKERYLWVMSSIESQFFKKRDFRDWRRVRGEFDTRVKKYNW